MREGDRLGDFEDRVEAAYTAGWVRRDPDALPEIEALAERAFAERHATAAVRLAVARARVLRVLGRLGDAVSVMDRALLLADELPVDLEARVTLLNYRALIAIDAGDLPDALAPAVLAWTLARETLPDLAGISATNLGMCLIDLGDFDGGRRWLERAAWEGQPPFSVAHVALGLALAAWRCRDLDALRAPLARLEAIEVPDGVVEQRVSGLKALARAWHAVLSGDPVTALEQVALGRPGFATDGNVSELAELEIVEAEAHRLSEDIEAARAAVARGLALDPDASITQQLHELGGALALQVDPRAAAEHYRAASEAHHTPRAQLGRALGQSLERLERDVHHAEHALRVTNDALRRANRELDEARKSLVARVEAATEELRVEVGVRKDAERRALAAAEAKSRFLASMSHELRTPLNAILGYTELLAEDPAIEASPDATSDLGHVRASGLRLLALIDDLLELTRTEAGVGEPTLESVDLNDLLAATRDLHPGINVQSEVVQPLMTDGPRLEQLVSQLVRSGLERGGPVDVRAWESDDGRVHIEVRDRGPEVSRSALARIDNPFDHADPRRPDGGLSLALAVARALCASLLGAFRIESGGASEGTRVRVSFARPRYRKVEALR